MLRISAAIASIATGLAISITGLAQTPDIASESGTRLRACRWNPDLLIDNFIAPTYPEEAIAQGLEGWCIAKYEVLADGRLDPSTITVTCTSEMFVEASKQTVARFRFPPIEPEAGVPGRCSREDAFEFRIPDAKSDVLGSSRE